MEGDGDARHVPLHAAVVHVVERADEIEAGPHATLWRRLATLMSSFPGTPDCAFKAAVYCNLVAVIALGDAEDYLATAALVRRFGHQKVANVQAELDSLLRIGPDLPLTTAAVLALARSTHIEHAVRRADHPAADAEATAVKCYNAAFWLLMADIDPNRPAPMPESSAELRAIVERGGANDWRRVLAIIASNPWGREVNRLAELAAEADLPAPAQALEWCAKVYRKRFEESERLEVAKEIRRLVAISGCSQRQFAQYIGTSPSRLSTYVNGLVTPSAAMMLRISRAAATLAQEAAGSGGVHT